MSKQRSIVVVGLGTFGMEVARRLSSYGDRVLGIDKDEKRVAAAAETIDRVVIADATEAKAMKEAGLGDYDVVVVATAVSLEVSLLSIVSAREAGAQTVWARSRGDTHTRILEQVGVERILHPTQSYGEQIAQQLHNPLVIGSVRLADGLHFAAIQNPPKLCGRQLGSLRLNGEGELRCVGLLRDGAFSQPDADLELCEVDNLLLIGSRSAMRSFVDRH